MKKNIIQILIFTLVARRCYGYNYHGKEGFLHRYDPWALKVQFAGNIGFLSTATSCYFWSDKIQSDLFYGYLPSYYAGRDIHTFAFKNTLELFRMPVRKKFTYTQSVGLSVNYSITKNTFISLPNQYPDKYYKPNAVHFAPYLAGKFIYKDDSSKFNNAGVYMELGTIDNYLGYYIKNVKTMTNNFTDLWNLAIGIVIPIKL